MKCLKCQFKNPEDAKFCGKCGNKLEIVCQKCGKTNRSDSKFCNECGHDLRKPLAPTESLEHSHTSQTLSKTAETAPLPEGERRQATILFSDLSGYTVLNERFDPEEVEEIMSRIKDEAVRIVESYGGIVNQFVGDEVLALFGIPTAHEDDPVRAVRAALELHGRVGQISLEVERRIGTPLRMHTGINTGLVVTHLRDHRNGSYGITGDAVNTAARIANQAGSDEILISSTTRNLITFYFVPEALEAVTFKGKAKPTTLYRMTGESTVHTRFEAAEQQGFTAFTGRDHELATLHSILDKAVAGSGQFVTVVGEAGVGKSRLVYEFRRSLGRNKITVLQGRCQSDGSIIPYFPFLNALRHGLQLREEDTPSELREKVVANVLAIDQTLATYLPLYLHLMSIPCEEYPLPKHLQGRDLKNAIQEALAAIITLNSKRQSMVLILEDWHLVDGASDSALKHLLDAIPPYPLMVVVIYRPQDSANWGNWSYHTPIVLKPLDSRNSEDVIKSVWAADRLPEGLSSLIHERTGGNPFFIEGICKALIEEGTVQLKESRALLTRSLEHLTLPDTVQAVIRARLDRVDRYSQELLGLASVIGKGFTLPILERISTARERLPQCLETLKLLELIDQIRVAPEATYMFKNMLIQEVTYETLLRQKRKELHGLVGQTIEELYPERLAEQYEVLAFHFAKGENWTKALEYYFKAGQKAAKTFATREAVALFDRALEAADQYGQAVDPNILMAIHQARSNLFFILSHFERSRAEGERALALARQVGDRVSEGAALAAMGWASAFTHDFDRALAYAHQSIEIAEQVDAKPVLTRGHLTMGHVYGRTGRLDQSEQEMKKVLTVSRSVGDVVNQSHSLTYGGLIKNWEGKFDEASRLISEGLIIAQEHNLLVPLLHGCFMHGITLTGKGDYDKALAALIKGLALTVKAGDEFTQNRMLNSLGWLYSECGDLESAMDFNRRASEGVWKEGHPETIANAELNLADIFLAKGDLALAQEFLDRIYRLTHDPATSEWMRWRYSTHLFASLGELWLGRGDSAKARKYADQCLEIATRTNSRKYLVKGWRLRGEIGLLRKQWEEAEAALQQALTIAEAIGNPTQLWKTHLAMGRLHMEAKKPETARQAYHATREVINQIKDSLRDPGLHASLESSAFVREIYDLSGSA